MEVGSAGGGGGEDGEGGWGWTRWATGEGEEHSEALTLSVPRELSGRLFLPARQPVPPSAPSGAWLGSRDRV